MRQPPAFVAVDLGAESGRVVLGKLERGKVSLAEVGRFRNVPLPLPDGLHWDITGLFRGALAGIEAAVREQDVCSIAVDAWGVDYGLLDQQGRLLGLPFHYRDSRTQGVSERVADRMAQARAFETTGIRQMPFNTVYQLLSEAAAAALEGAHSIALIPDLLAYWLGGVLANERTDASTTGLLDARTGGWAADLIGSLGLPAGIFGDLVDPGTVLGPLSAAHAQALGASADVQVVATAGHDTAAAFAGTPLQGDHGAILSSGTWSLMGVESDSPVLTRAAEEAGLSNERGVFGTVRLLRNVMGLWLLQECRRAWTEQGMAPSYEELVRSAAASSEEPALFDPDHPSLLYPGDMLARIESLISHSGQAVPSDRGGLVNSIFVSLACKYRLVVELLGQVTSRTIDTIHVVGGGSRNEFLCQLTADITGREVLTGPAEASALGNVLVQAYALGHASSFEEMRDISRASFPPVRYVPSADRRMAEATYQRFVEVTSGASDHSDSPQQQGRNE